MGHTIAQRPRVRYPQIVSTAHPDQIPARIPLEALPSAVEWLIEVPKGGFVKRDGHGKIDFVSPLPCPFNYGSSVEHMSADGEGMDVVVLGPRLSRGTRGRLPLVGRVRFRDQGLDDHKWICSAEPLADEQLTLLDRFFSAYALGKLAWTRYRGLLVETRYAGVDVVRDGRVVRALNGGSARARFRSKPWRGPGSGDLG